MTIGSTEMWTVMERVMLALLYHKKCFQLAPTHSFITCFSQTDQIYWDLNKYWQIKGDFISN